MKVSGKNIPGGGHAGKTADWLARLAGSTPRKRPVWTRAEWKEAQSWEMNSEGDTWTPGHMGPRVPSLGQDLQLQIWL